MRNLKRALSLTLASVMLLGMMVIGTSAASFTDADQITNETAATVLQELEVMQGSNGKFNPNGTVTRGQMAILICKMLYGSKLTADNFGDTQLFDDCPAGAYYTGYVNLASQLGIISGYGNGKFGPGSPVTTAQAALMLTRALGWFQAGELEGQSWASNAMAAMEKATDVNLFGSLRLGNNAPLSRDNVAEMVFNALTKTAPVKYNERWDTYYSKEGGIISGVKFDYLDSLGYKNFTLVYDNNGAPDAFGRPSVVWGIGDGELNSSDIDTSSGNILDGHAVIKDEIITAPKGADKTYVGEVKAKAIYTDLLRDTVSAGNVTVYVDGVKNPYASGENSGKDEKVAIVKDGSAKWGSDGQTVEVYYDKKANKADDEVTLCVTSTYLGVVVDDNYTQDKKTGIRIDVLGEGGGLKFFEATGYKEDDVVLVNLSDGEVKAIVGTPKTVTGESTRLGTDSALTINSKKYPQSVKFSSGDGSVVDGKNSGALGVEKDYTLYLDQNDCYLAAVENEDNSTTDLVYVFRVYEGNTLDGDEVKAKLMATVVLMDGTYKTVAVTKVNDTNITDAAKWLTTDPGGGTTNKAVYTGTLMDLVYDEDDKEYELKAPAASRFDVTNDGAVAAGTDLDADDRYVTIGGSSVYLNGSTVYLFVTGKDADGADAQGTKIDEVKVLTGGADFKFPAGSTTTVPYAKKGNESAAKYVVVPLEYAAAAGNVVYIKAASGTPYKNTIKDGVTYDGWFADSTEKEQIPVDKNSTASYMALSTGFYKYSEKSNGNLDLTAAAASTAKGTPSNGGYLTGSIGSVTKDDKGYLMTLGTATAGNATGRTFDLKDVNVIDMTDKDKKSENTYGSNVTSLSALERAVNAEAGGSKRYTVSVTIYVNKDDEVVNLLITKIGAGAVSLDTAGLTATTVTDALKGGKTVTLGSSATLSGATTITEGTLVLSNAGNLNSQTLTVKTGATVEVKAAQTNGEVKLDGGVLNMSESVAVPKLASGSKGTVTIAGSKTADFGTLDQIFANTNNFAVKATATETATNTYGVSVQRNGVSITGAGRITGFSSIDISDANPSLYSFKFPETVVKSDATRAAASVTVNLVGGGTRAMQGTTTLDGEVVLLLGDDVASVVYTFAAEGGGQNRPAATVTFTITG